MDDHDWFGDAPDAGWGFTQLVRPSSRQPLGELSGNAQQAAPLGDRDRVGACDEPIVVYDVSDSGSGSDEDGDVEVLPACITQLYDRHEEAPPDDEEEGEEEDDDPVQWISEHDVGYVPCAGLFVRASPLTPASMRSPCEPPEERADEDPGFEPVQMALEVLQVRPTRLSPQLLF